MSSRKQAAFALLAVLVLGAIPGCSVDAVGDEPVTTEGKLIILGSGDEPLYGEAYAVVSAAEESMTFLVWDFDGIGFELRDYSLDGEVSRSDVGIELDEYHVGQTKFDADSRGRVWFANGTSLGRVQDGRLTPVGQITATASDPGDSRASADAGLPDGDHVVLGLAIDADDDVWLAVAGSRELYEYGPDTGSVSTHALPPEIGVASDLMVSKFELIVFDVSTAEQRMWIFDPQKSARNWEPLEAPGTLIDQVGDKMLFREPGNGNAFTLLDATGTQSRVRVSPRVGTIPPSVLAADEGAIWFLYSHTLVRLELSSGDRTEYVVPETRGGASMVFGDDMAAPEGSSANEDGTVILTPVVTSATLDDLGNLWFSWTAGESFVACALK